MEWDVVKEMGRNSIKSVSHGIKATARFVGSTYMLPSTFRRHPDPDDFFNVTIPISFLFGTFEGVLAFSGESTSGKYLYAAPLLVRIGTNIASGIYEWYRYEKNKKYGHSPSGSAISGSSPFGSSSPSKLEEKVEKEEKKVHLKDVPNPWDIDIPKIEDQKVRRYHDERRM